ncbi:MAG: phytanoyl-CoA dioxygenase family protein [Hylemonella sp.]|nr:phytanoyl-CoA dioxygenase family protein [Hylemonella sp.]
MNNQLIEKFQRDGFIVLRDFFKGDTALDEVRSEITSIGKLIVGNEFRFDVFDRELVTREKQSLLYDRLHYLPSLSRLSGNRALHEAMVTLGMKHPVLMGCCNMRYDVPRDAKHLFDWHQDSIYLLGSLNAVTIWIPFGPVDEQHGSIEVIPGSHVRGIYPFKKISEKPVMQNIPFLQRDLAIDYEVQETPVAVTADVGDIVVFNQMLLHRSTPNSSLRPRWTAQIRLSDLGCQWFIENKCPTGDKKNIFNYRYPGFHHPQSKV